MISSIARRCLVGAGADAAPGSDVLVSMSLVGGCVGFRSGANDDDDEGSAVSKTTGSE